MRPNLLCRHEGERQAVRLWRSNRLSPGTIAIYLRWVHHFRAYCSQRGLDETSQLTRDGAVRFARAYVGPRNRGAPAAKTRSLACNALRAWAWARHLLKVPVPPWKPKKPAARLSPLLAAYCEHRRSRCGVAKATLGRDVETAKAFVLLLQRRGKSVHRAGITDIDRFVLELSRRVSRSTVRDRGKSLRAFLRFLQLTGRLHRDLASCVVTPRIRLAERPPRALLWIQVRRLLRSIPQTLPPGKRDYAMLLMMATYGLGAAEVLGLRLEDVDWKSAVLRVRRPKTGTPIELPLLSPVARALAAYLGGGRPRPAEARQIFLNARIPYEPLTSGAIGHRIRYYAGQVGITSKVLGAHVLRHSHASRQIDLAANLKVVSDILGHRHPSSTSVYVRVALRRLRSVALPVPR